MRTILSTPKTEMIRRLRRLLWALAGTSFAALSLNLFIVPSGLYTGGIMGFCQLLRTLLVEYLNFPAHFDIAGIIYYIINIPIFIIAYKQVGRWFLFKTLICVTWYTIMISVIPIPETSLLPDDVLATCIIAGIITGFGTGTTLKMGSSGGGMDIVGIMLIKWKKDFSVGRISLIVNLVLYSVFLLLFDVPTVIYSLIYSSASSFAVDKVHTQNINMEVNIITKKCCPEMENEIFNELGRGITKWTSMGAYTHETSEVLYILASKYEVGHLKEIIRKYDPNAFIVVKEGVRVDGNYLVKL
ncbi:MAG: YitT family protein [Lachnospiraceae bacterium]|nr:YitT family protein [Lachnospiraceae bacterium]